MIAGSSSCPYFAKIELLADQLAGNLPNFKIHKIIKPEDQWLTWLEDVCDKNKWNHAKSPIVWRELVDRGGKGLLIGGFNDFMEYAQCYYGVTSNVMTDLMLKMRDENKQTTKEKEEEEEYYKSLSKPIHICITNASCQTAYNLVSSIASGEVFGKDIEISLRLLDNRENMKNLHGVEMEAWDLSYPLLRQITLTSDVEVAFKDATAVVILDEVSLQNEKGQTDSRPSWLERNAKHFERYAEVLNSHALPEVKVIVSGKGPVNFNTHVLIDTATNLSKQNIVAASRLQERRMRAILAKRLKVNSVGVKDAIVWGDCSYDGAERTFADVSIARCHGYDGAVWGPEWFSRSVVEMTHDDKWLAMDFLTELKDHHDNMNEILNHETSSSSASALSSLLRDWFQGTGGGEIYSLGVESEGWYGVKNCVFSLPVKFDEAGSYQVVWDINLDDEKKKKITDLELQLKKDIQAVFPEQVQLEEEKVFGDNPETVTASLLQDSLTKPIASEKLEIIEEENEVTNEAENKDQDSENVEEDSPEEAEQDEEETEQDEEETKAEDE